MCELLISDCQYIFSRNGKGFLWMATAGPRVLFDFFSPCLLKIVLTSRCCLLRFLSWAPVPLTSIHPSHPSLLHRLPCSLEMSPRNSQESPGLQCMSLAYCWVSIRNGTACSCLLSLSLRRSPPPVKRMKPSLEDQLWLFGSLRSWRGFSSPSVFSQFCPPDASLVFLTCSLLTSLESQI